MVGVEARFRAKVRFRSSSRVRIRRRARFRFKVEIKALVRTGGRIGLCFPPLLFSYPILRAQTLPPPERNPRCVAAGAPDCGPCQSTPPPPPTLSVDGPGDYGTPT